jgi:hypothetical protein
MFVCLMVCRSHVRHGGGVMRIMARVGDVVHRTEDGCTGRVLSGRTIERSGDTVCGLHRARVNEEREFLG